MGICMLAVHTHRSTSKIIVNEKKKTACTLYTLFRQRCVRQSLCFCFKIFEFVCSGFGAIAIIIVVECGGVAWILLRTYATFRHFICLCFCVKVHRNFWRWHSLTIFHDRAAPRWHTDIHISLYLPPSLAAKTYSTIQLEKCSTTKQYLRHSHQHWVSDPTMLSSEKLAICYFYESQNIWCDFLPSKYMLSILYQLSS